MMKNKMKNDKREYEHIEVKKISEGIEIRWSEYDFIRYLFRGRWLQSHGMALGAGARQCTPDVLREIMTALGAYLVEVEEDDKDQSEKFNQHLKHASEVVKGWPKWKQNLLGGTKDSDEKTI